MPHRTDTVRVVIQADDGGQIGTAELDHKTLLMATESPTPEPHLVPRPQPVTMVP
jgi:hypothetical protein